MTLSTRSIYSLAVLSLAFSILVAPLPVLAAPGDVIAVRVLESGWQAEIDIQGFEPGGTYAFGLGPSNDPTNATVRLMVTSQGYDENGTLGTRTRTVYGTQFVRLAYPNQASKNERVTEGVLTVTVALSDFVYADDEDGGAGTSGVDIAASIASGFYRNAGAFSAAAALTAENRSTVAYPKSIGRFAWPGYERVGATIPVEVVAFQKFARDGKPVAAVVVEAADQHGGVVSQTVRDMTVSTRGTDAHPVQVYRADLSTATLSQGDAVTVNFRAYPWIGDEASVLNSAVGADGAQQPSAELGPLSFVNDKDGTYGGAFALVSPSAATSTGIVYASRSAAESAGAATAFQNIGKAAEAIKAYQTTNYGRATAAGGTILLAEGSYAFPGHAPADLGAMNMWLTVTTASGARKEFTSITSASNKVFPAQKLKIEGISFNSTASNVLKGRAATDMLWLHNSDVTLPTLQSIVGYKYAYLTQNDFHAIYSKLLIPIATPLVRGNETATLTKVSLYAVLGNNNMQPTFIDENNAYSHPSSDNAIFAYSSLYKMVANVGALAQLTDVDYGLAIVGNVMENLTGAQPVLQIAADSTVANADHVLLWRNTMVGQRTNLGYNDHGSEPWSRLNWSSKFNVFQSWNNKDDTFVGPTGPSATRIGAWPVGYNVGSVANIVEGATFRGEFDGLRTAFGPVDVKYVHDASFEGDRTGGGDYQILEGSPAIDLALAEDTVLPYDFAGMSVSGASADAGAYEYQSGPPPLDTTPPAILIASPLAMLPAGTNETQLEVLTNEVSTCVYGPNTLPMQTDGGRAHTVMLSGLANGQSYSYAIVCNDGAANPGSVVAEFAVAAPAPDTAAPVVSVTAPSASLSSGTTEATLGVSTDESAYCAYSQTSGTAYASMTPFASTGATAHAVPLAGLADGQSYTYYVKCKDVAENISNDSVATFSVSQAAPAGPVPVLRLSFDGATVNETLGTVQDVSGNGNNGVLVNTPVRTAGHSGEALEFNGANYVDLGTGSFGLSQSLTMSFWMRRTADNAAASYDSVFARGAYVNPFAVTFASGGRVRLGTRTSNTTYLQTSAGTPIGSWTHIVITYDAGVRTVYIDGVMSKTDTVTGSLAWTGSNRTYLGKSPLAPAEGLIGAIDDLRIYDRSLSAAEVGALYAAP